MALVPDPPVAVHFDRFVAIDWSGAVGERQRGIAVASADRGSTAPRLERPDHRWSRADVLGFLQSLKGTDTLVGLDLGLSLPFADRGAFFPEWADSPDDARALWALVDRLCADDPHLAASSFVDHPDASRHFRRHGGRTGDLFEPGRGRLRITERHQLAQGVSPVSNLNLVGAAQVGKSSLTGMRVLNRLAGTIPVWPFDALPRSGPRSGPLITEIYTSIAARAAGVPRGRSKMADVAALNGALTAPAIASEPVGDIGAIDDHRSDALLTAAWLRAHADCVDLWAPAALTPEIACTEGWTFGVT